MILTAIDPGMSTGLCQFSCSQLGNHVVFHDTLNVDDLTKYFSSLITDVLVIERLPTLVQAELATIISIVKRYDRAKKVMFISPGEWKPLAKAHKWSFPEGRTQHEKDAFCLATYAIRFKLKELQNE